MSSEHLDFWARLSRWARPERSAEWIARQNYRMAIARGYFPSGLEAREELARMGMFTRWRYRMRYHLFGWYGGKNG